MNEVSMKHFKNIISLGLVIGMAALLGIFIPMMICETPLPSPTPIITPIPTPELTPEPTPVVYPLGVGVSVGDISIVINKAELPGFSEFFAPREGCNVYKINMSITNNGDEAIIINKDMFNCYANEVECVSYRWRNAFNTLEVSCGETIDGWLCFHVPKNATSLELKYIFNEYETTFKLF